MNILDENATKYPTDSDMRWKQMDPLWGRGSSQIIKNIKIKEKYLKAMFKTSLEEGVQYIESRSSLSGGLYTLDPTYSDTNGKRYFDNTVEHELNFTTGIIKNFTRDNPDFIGMKRVVSTSRSSATIAKIKDKIQHMLKFHKKYPSFIVGYDLVSEEDQGRSHLFFLDSFLTLYDDKAKRKKIDLYLHTAETNFAADQRISQHQDDPVAALKNTYDAILLGAKRVGHGLGFIKHPYLMKLMKDRKIAVEVCPISNQLLGFQADLRNHPAQTYIRYGVPVVMGSDDPGTFGYDHFTVDWYMAYFGWGLDLADLKLLAKNSMQYSAMPAKEKKSAMQKFESYWKKYIDNTKTEACQKVFRGNPVFAKVLPIEGARSGSTKVYIYGSNFQAGICKDVKCKFGDKVSTKTQMVTTELIVCESPPLDGAGEEDDDGVKVAVQVSFDGENYVETSHNFTYMYDRYVHPTPPPAVINEAATRGPIRWSIYSFILICIVSIIR